MTDHDHSAAPGGHLDDEALSAVLDGEATPAESVHADGCETCTARLGELRDASLLVRTPVALADSAARDAAVAAAVAGAGESNVVKMRRRTTPAWLAAAAVLVIAVGALALANRGDDDSQSTAASKSAEDDGAFETTTVAPFAQALVAPVDGGDIGEVKDADLRTTIDHALASRVERETAGDAASGGASSAAAAPTSCEPTVRDGNPKLGPLVFEASGTYDGEPVAVLAFDVTSPDGKATRWVYVLSAGGCAIKNQTTYSV